jgi:ATP-binding cassette subfamily E protein 1
MTVPPPFPPPPRLPTPRPGQVLGLVGTNGIGKSTALKVLAGKLKPNLGRFTVSRRGGWRRALGMGRGTWRGGALGRR